MRRSLNCASARRNGGFRLSAEKIAPMSAVCVLLVSRANLLSPWQTASNGVNLKQLSVVILQLHVNRLVQFADFSFIFHRTALDRACLFTGV